MSLIKINDLLDLKSGVLATVTDLEFQTVTGGNNTGVYQPINLPDPNKIPTGVSVAYAYAQAQSQPIGQKRLDFGISTSFSGTYNVNSPPKFKSQIAYYASSPVPVSVTVKHKIK